MSKHGNGRVICPVCRKSYRTRDLWLAHAEKRKHGQFDSYAELAMRRYHRDKLEMMRRAEEEKGS